MQPASPSVPQKQISNKRKFSQANPAHNQQQGKNKKQKTNHADNGLVIQYEIEEYRTMHFYPQFLSMGSSAHNGLSNFVNGKHPFGIQPWGNYYLQRTLNNDCDARVDGLGYFAYLSDEFVLDLFAMFSYTDLGLLSRVSKAMNALCNEDELWREICFDEYDGDFVFQGSWKKTFNARLRPSEPIIDVEPLPVTNFFSDVLFHTWQCSNIDLKQWRELLKGDNTPRCSGLSPEEFANQYTKPNLPVLITDLVEKWPAATAWTRENLIAQYSEVNFVVGGVGISLKLKDFLTYCSQAHEESPLYLFDREYPTKAPNMLNEYIIPEYFKEDFFDLLPDADRPTHRWILIGPPKSGSTFHQDPNSTSAWNAVISGSKKWILYPPEVIPPGVFLNDDGVLTTTMSVVEWFLNFYKETKKPNSKAVECVQKAGEVLFIPHGWWHLAMNLEETVAVTQNFVDRYNVINVVNYLQNKKKKELWSVFESKMQENHPDVLERVKKELNEKKQVKLSAWEELVGRNTPFTLLS